MPPAAIPLVRRTPVLGTLQALFTNRLKLLTEFGRDAGDIGRMRFGARTTVLVNAPAYIHKVLVEHEDAFQKGPALSVFSRPLLGDGLLTSEGDFHRRQRRLIAPAFLPRRVAGYADTMAALAEQAQQRWAHGATIDVAQEMMRLTLGIVGKTLFDADLLGEADDLGTALTTAMQFAIRQIRAPIRIPLHWPLPQNRRARRAMLRLNETIYRMIAERRAAGEDKGDLLSMLLEARDEENGSGMSDEQVRDEAMTLFLAGHETTANAMAWTWYLLARHPDIYARVQEEVDQTLGGRTPAYADLPGMPFTLQVLKEAMRLYPPAYALGRQAIRDVTVGGYRIDQGAVVLISAYLMHRKPEYFPDPERFDPDRFAPDAEKALPRYAYMPFGGGPRLCIGNHFALMEGQILLAALAQRVTFRLAPGRRIAPEPLITLRPKGGVRMIVERRG